MSVLHAAFVESLVILAAMSAAGLVHTAWMRSRVSRRFDAPIDGGRSFRGRRILGDHKTVRGFLAIVPAAGAAFGALGALRDAGVEWLAPGLWGFAPLALFGLGAWAGLCFMAGELPNSFFKRRYGIAPGTVPARGAMRLFCLALDRVDSTLALLAGMSVVVGLHWLTWLAVLVFGPLVHFGFSALLHVVGVKARYA